MLRGPIADRQINTGDGRVLGISEWGDPQGNPVFWLHGAPGSRLLRHVGPSGMEDVYGDRHLRVVTYDRPGYGRSTRRPDRRVVDVVEDVQAIADQLELEQFGVAGVSVGGSAAVAVAARLPERVSRLGLVAAVAPILAPDLDFFAGMDADARNGYDFAGLDGPDLEAWLERDWEETLVFVRDVLPTLGTTPGMEMFQAALEEGMRPGPAGLRDDLLALVAEWGFDMSRVRMPVRVIQAEDDTSVPRGHSDWWLRHLPQAEMKYIPGGHVGASGDEADRLEQELALLAWMGAADA